MFCRHDVEEGGVCAKCGTSDSTRAREYTKKAQERAWYGVTAVDEHQEDMLTCVPLKRRVRAEKKAD
jgi:hypothetical protein